MYLSPNGQELSPYRSQGLTILPPILRRRLVVGRMKTLPRRVNFGMMSCRASVFVSDKIIDAVLPELSFSHHYSNTHHCSAPHLFFLIDAAANNSGLQISLGLTSLPLSFTSIPSGQIRRESPLFFGTPPHFQRAFV